MRNWRRRLTILVMAGYMLAVSASARFHHHDCDDGGDSRPGVSATHGDSHDCSVCQFLAQKPAPTTDVAPVDLSTLVQQVLVSSPAIRMCGVFTAWQSRAPPLLA